MARYVAAWAEVALDQYLALSVEQQSLVDRRLTELLDSPDGQNCRYDQGSDTWTATTDLASGLLVYTFRRDAPRLIVLRLIFL